MRGVNFLQAVLLDCIWGRLRTGIALHKLARCYERAKDVEAAARCYEANLARIDAEQLQGQDAPDALLFLATYKKVRRNRVLLKFPLNWGVLWKQMIRLYPAA